LTSFAPLLRLDLRHDYCGDFAPVVLEPDPDTRRLAARPDLRLRLWDGCAELFAADDRTALALLAEDGALVLTFRLRPRDPMLAAMTATVAEARDRIVVLDPGRSRSGALHRDDMVGPADLRSLTPDGLVTPADVARPPLAILRLTPDPEARDVAYTVRFGAVERFWTYHVIGGAFEAEYGVQDRDGALTFDPLGPRKMANGTRAQSFRSSAPIAERARPAARFQLVSEGDFGPRVILATLPCPRAGPGTVDPGGHAASEILVNLW
jgi:hypothetical protein